MVKRMYAALFGMMILIPLVWFIIGILLCIWVYKDAERRGMNAVLWLIVVLISGIIGFIIYLVVRKEGVAPPPSPPPQVTS
jgi:TctA family transporter